MSRNFLRPLGAVSRQCRPRRMPVRPALPRTTATPRFAAPLHTAPSLQREKPPKEPPPTDFEELDVLGNTPVPATAVDNCLDTGFILNGGVRVTDGSGVLLANGEAFRWRPWEASGRKELVNRKGQFEVPGEAFGVLDLLWPRPDLLILGVGPRISPLSPETRKHISSLGMRVEVLDTRNAAAQFNLLATERGVDDVAAVLIPVGWKEGEGAVES